MTVKTVAKIGLIICALYFFMTTVVVVTGNSLALLLFEIITMLSGIYMVLLIATLPFPKEKRDSLPRKAAISCAALCMVITNMVHCINIAVIQPMVANGTSVPDYLTLGLWPSVITAVEYLAWGQFLALAFLLSALISKPEAKIKLLLYVCGCLCAAGFFGVIFVNEFCWYISPLGYGIGTAIICVKLLLVKTEE